MAQAVPLPGLAKLTLEQTAAVLGVGRATVARLQTRFRHPGERPPACPRSALGGGRRRALLSRAQEPAFMADWQAAAERGEWGVLPPLRAALDRQLGRRVKPSVVYGLVQRHRWRKVAPDTRQPQADPPGPREWKKNAARKPGGRVDGGGGAGSPHPAEVSGRGSFRPAVPETSSRLRRSSFCHRAERSRAKRRVTLCRSSFRGLAQYERGKTNLQETNVEQLANLDRGLVQVSHQKRLPPPVSKRFGVVFRPNQLRRGHHKVPQLLPCQPAQLQQRPPFGVPTHRAPAIQRYPTQVCRPMDREPFQRR